MEPIYADIKGPRCRGGVVDRVVVWSGLVALRPAKI